MSPFENSDGANTVAEPIRLPPLAKLEALAAGLPDDIAEALGLPDMIHNAKGEL